MLKLSTYSHADSTIQMKRLFDIVVATLALAVFALPLLFLVLLVRRKLGRPAFFRQVRPGLDGKPFEMVKLRTMTDGRDVHGNLLPDSERLTPFGRFLRSTSLDELPELWNVLKGDMSLVGPRPLLMEYLPLYSADQRRRHEVRPGITGWAQINGRNALSWSKKFELDVWYVENRSIWLDIRILWLTVKKVIVRDGISAAGEATMSKFTGGSA
jgi:lipopolysaccharide/colanic/teichoic acid biosynthesis glycosyltransferase